MAKKQQFSNMTLYGIGLGFVIFVGSALSMKSTLFPEPLAACTQRYLGGLDFPSQTASAQPVSIRDIQTKLGFDEWGLVENVTLAKMQVGPYGAVIDVALPAGTSGDKSAARKGGVSFTWKPGIQGGTNAACLSYAVNFPSGFEFSEGGMLPGLFGGDEPRLGKAGFGARFMWRQGSGGDVLLTMPGTGERGAGLPTKSWNFPTGRWVNVEQEVRLNTPGQSNGTLAIWIDGVLRVEMHNIAFRKQDNVRIAGVLSDVYYNAPAPSETTLQLTNFNLRWK
jgi:hypothetical protein